MSKSMLRVADIDWSQVLESRETPFEVLLRKDLAVYMKVRRDSEVVYRLYSVPVSGGALPLGGFLEEATFLRLDNTALAEIAVSGSCFLSSHSRGGLAIARPYDVVGVTRGGYVEKKFLPISDPELKRIEFDRAFVVARKAMDHARKVLGVVDSPEQYAIQHEVRGEDLYIADTDYQALVQERSAAQELIEYPFSHRDRMPGLYWMFQAAYVHNQLKKEKKDGVRGWLLTNAPEHTFRYKSLRTAEKFVWLDLDRSKGKRRERITWDELEAWAGRENYQFSFVSIWFSTILAIADWWVDITLDIPSEPLLTLAKRLDERKFAGLEVEDLVYLIGGSPMSPADRDSFQSYLAGLRRARHVGKE